jgi:hypothetical protein
VSDLGLVAMTERHNFWVSKERKSQKDGLGLAQDDHGLVEEPAPNRISVTESLVSNL